MTDRGWLNYLIDCGLIITFILSFITGFIKVPEWTRYFGNVYLLVPASIVSKIHDVSGVVMGLLVLVHLLLHRKWIIAMTKTALGRKEV